MCGSRQRASSSRLPIETEPWGERYFQVSDPNGIVIQLVTWVGTPPHSGWAMATVEAPDGGR